MLIIQRHRLGLKLRLMQKCLPITTGRLRANFIRGWLLLALEVESKRLQVDGRTVVHAAQMGIFALLTAIADAIQSTS